MILVNYLFNHNKIAVDYKTQNCMETKENQPKNLFSAAKS